MQFSDEWSDVAKFRTHLRFYTFSLYLQALERGVFQESGGLTETYDQI